MLFKKHLILVNIIKMISSENEWPSQGEYIDFKDKDNNPWQVGYIVSKAKNIMKVRSQGWSSKFDQFIHTTNTTRIKPFRTIVRGYTGQVKNPALRQHWKFTLETQQQNVRLLNDFLNSIQSKTEHQIKQFLRGSHYFWIDFLLTITYSAPEELTSAYDYLKQHIKFTKKYLDQVAEVGIYQWCSETIQITEQIKAYRQSYYQIMDALFLLTGINLRQIQFQKNNDKVIKLATNQNYTHEKHITKYMGQVKLDETYLKIVNKLQKETFVENKIIPIPFLYQFFHIFAPIQRSLLQKTDPPFDGLLNNKQQRKKLTLRILNIIKKQIDYITPLQLKLHQNQKEIDSLLLQIKAIYFKYGLQQLTFQWIEKVKLKVSFLLIQSDTLQRKLKGITRIKQIYQVLVTHNQFNTFKLKNQDFASFLKENRIIQCLYENNEHPQILKKGSQICQLFIKSNFIQINSIISIWATCSHKHEAIRKVIYQLWIDLIPFIDRKDLQHFTQPLINSNLINQNDIVLFTEQWEIQMLFTFVNNLIKQFEQITIDRQQIDAIFAKFIDLMYQKLILVQSSTQIKQLIPSLAKLVNTTLICNKIIKQAYQSIAKNIHTKLNLQLLMSFYQESFEKQTYLPSNALQIIFFAFQSPKNTNLSSTIFQLMDQIINFSSNITGNYILNQQKFQSLWTISQKNEQIKTQFYSWLIKKNNDGLFGVPIYEINQSIPNEVKSVIFKNFLCDHNKLDYFNLSLEELKIFKEFMIYENQQQNRIQLKKMMTLVKIVRIKNGQIIGNKFMWDIFLNCKNQEVIKQLSKIIIIFHFNYHQSMNFAAKKPKVVNLMIKLQKHIKDGFKKGNLKLIKHSLILLKDIIDLVKEKHEPKQIINSYQQFFKTSIKVLFQNKKYQLQIFFGVTYYEIKGKIAEMIKLERTQFQMFSLKNEEISLQFGQVPFCFMQQKTIKVIRILQSQQTIGKIVLDFTKDRLQNILIDMLQDESICQNVYNVLEDIEIKVEQGEQLLDKLMNIIEKNAQQKKESSSKYQIYIYLFYLRILHFMIQRPKFLDKFIKNKQLNKLVQRLQLNINNSLIVVYLFNSTDIIFNIFKKIRTRQESQEIQEIVSNLKEVLKQKCMTTMNNICHFINNSSIEQKQKDNMKKVRIIFNCLNIIEEIEKTDKTIYFLAQHPLFTQIVTKIYLHNNINEVRLIFSQKLKKIIHKSRETVKNSNNQLQVQEYTQLIDKITKLFIGDLYSQIIKSDGVYSSYKKVLPFYKFIAFTISLVTTAEFKTSIVGTKDQPKFYANLLIRLKQLSDHQDATASPNYILSSHLLILHSIYLRDPSLLTEDILHYLLYQCLFYQQGKSNTQDASCKRPETIKAALDVVQAGCLDYSNSKKLLKVISEIVQFHKIEYWRSSDNWSTSIQSEVKAKYVGLQNPGCICYLNSLVQQLYMTKTFRNAITGLDLKSQENDKLQMLKSLKELFFNLQYSQEIALSPIFFTKTIKSHDNKPLVKIFMQMDIDQFCSILFDKIQNHLTLIPNQPNIVKNIFGGIYAHQIISKECNHCSQREQQFISIGLEVKKNIQQSFNTLIKGQMLDGENKYYCQKCDKKVKAEKILTIKKLPQNLILSIKRFEYNYEIDAKIKINDYCQFPMQLNLKKYSQQQINKANTPQNINLSQENNENINKEHPDEYFMYKLKGVVVHTGSADSGHYYSFIQDSEKNWFQFNDSHVTPFDVKNLAEQAFGTKDSFEQKVKNAYLLFYERVQSYSEQTEPTQLSQNQQNIEIIHQIIDKNKTINKFRLLFSKDYANFVNNILDNIQKYDLTLDQQQKWHHFILTYYLLIKIREGSVEQIVPMSNKILNLIKTNKYFSNLFLSSITHLNFLQQLFVYSSNRQKIKIISKLLYQSFINYYEQLPNNYNSLKETLVQKLFNHIKYLIAIHGNIYQIQLFIQSVLTHTKNKNDHRLFTYATHQHSLEKYILINTITASIPKQEKELFVKYREQHIKQENSVISQVKNEGKKYLPSISKQSWQLIQYFLEFIEPKEIVQQQEEQSTIVANVNTLLDKIIKNGNLTRIIHECGISKSVYRLYKVFKITNKVYYLVQAIEKGLKDFESTKYRPLLLLLYMIVVDQETSEKIIKIVIEMLGKVHTVNEKYFLQVNFIHQWMLKYINNSPIFLKNIALDTQFLTQIVNWIISKPMPSSEIIKKHKNPANQRLINRLDGILVSSDPKDYFNKSNFLRKKFQNIRDKKFQLINTHEKWQKQYLDEFSVEQQVYFFDMSNKKWNKFKIIENSFGLLKLQHMDHQDKNHFLIWQDNERLSSSFKAQIQEQDESSGSEQEIETGLDAVEQQQDLYT